MLYLLISCVSFIIVSKSFTNKQAWQEGKLKLFSIGLSNFVVSWFQKSRLHTGLLQPISFRVRQMVMKGSASRVVVENVDQEQEGGHVCLLDLPDLTLECILEKLSPSGLCRLAGVCTSMRDRCISDHFWEKHMKQKWSRLIGAAAYKEWELQHVDLARRRNSQSHQSKKKSVFESLSGFLPFCSWMIRPKLQSCRVNTTSVTTLPVDSVMSLYLSLEKGDFWFPAQVYNRENGNVGFMLSCYDAQLSYDSATDTFQARYSPYGRRTMEEHIPWDRLRAAPVDTPSHMLYASDCLHDLKPGDHIEIQWRRSKEFPYGWWYGVIGHFDLCDGNENHCHCHYSDIVVLEFRQYTPGSRWRQMMINRNDHREEGNEADGFYGGIRKLYNAEEIAKWKLLWPNQVLESPNLINWKHIKGCQSVYWHIRRSSLVWCLDYLKEKGDLEGAHVLLRMLREEAHLNADLCDEFENYVRGETEVESLISGITESNQHVCFSCLAQDRMGRVQLTW